MKNSFIEIFFSQIPENVLIHLTKLAPQMRMELSALIDMLSTLEKIVTDADFINQSLAINDVIAVLSADN